jgi:hypothetical protein
MYVYWGGRTIGLTPAGIARELRPVAASVVVQALITAAAALAAKSAGASTLVAGLAGAGAGALALALMLWMRARNLLDECRGVLTAALARRSAEA